MMCTSFMCQLLSPQDGCTPLMYAASEGHAEVAQMLLKAGAKVDQALPVRSCCG